ncbi:MAG: GTPase HflX [Gammaproteobacteria bacterium]|nr:GTPase HflX [Gammaproteobacteria bacterium]
MLERPDGGERAVLIHVDIAHRDHGSDPEEFRELALSAGVQPVAELSAKRVRPDPKYYIGQGKATELKELVAAQEAEVALFDQELSPAQERNLERLLSCRVLGRSGLILDIFAQRARSFEGKLQVEMAQLKHLSTRLVRGWTHLERQKGGIGLRGPGETQLETDRRLIGVRIKQLGERLEKVRRQRRQGSRARKRAELSQVSLVGYTNAGKSTLFNRLTEAGTYAADQLFATLDTTLRRINVPGEHPVILSDTVGFIRNLPPELIAAFQATLEESKDATLLLHVIDAHAEESDMHQTEVRTVLERIGAAETPRIEVYNKIDLMPDQEPRIERDAEGVISAVWVSAYSGAGIGLLLEAIAERLNRNKTRREVHIPPQAARLRAQLYALGAISGERLAEDGGWNLDITLGDERWERLAAEAGLTRAEVPAPKKARTRRQRAP